jgi:hypothetical protein
MAVNYIVNEMVNLVNLVVNGLHYGDITQSLGPRLDFISEVSLAGLCLLLWGLVCHALYCPTIIPPLPYVDQNYSQAPVFMHPTLK